MRFTELNELIPYARYGKEKVLSMNPYPDITLALPGRHAEDTNPKGGDFVVMVDDKKAGWKKHQFTHTDIFQDVEAKRNFDDKLTNKLMKDYLDVVAMNEPVMDWTPSGFPGLHPGTFLKAAQCLAVAEHRRYAEFEAKFGGRFLPFRFAAGIAEGLWTAADAADKQKKGRPGVEWLEKDFGLPGLTDMLINP